MINHSYLTKLPVPLSFDLPSFDTTKENLTIDSESLFLEGTIMAVPGEPADNKTRFIDFWLQEYNGFVEKYLNDDDRLSVITSVALIERFLKEYLSLLFIDYSNESDVRSYVKTMPVSNVKKQCLLLGIMTKKDFKDLDIVFEIRNKFAHSYGDLDFNSHELIELTKKLILPTKEVKSYKEYFLLRIAIVIGQCINILQKNDIIRSVTIPEYKNLLSK